MPAKSRQPRFIDAALPMRAALADYCDQMANLTNDGRWRQAAGALRGRGAGRRPVDDEAPLAYVEALLASGMAGSLHRACGIAAQMYAASHQVDTMRDRLRRKFRTKPINSEDAEEGRA